MNKLLLLVHVVTFLLPYSWRTAAQIACPHSGQRVISYDNSLLPPSTIAATSEDAASNPVDQLFGRNNVPFNLWCTAPESGIRHEINVSFTEPVVITGIVSSGFANGYVAEFTVEYSLTDPPDALLPYKVFNVPEIDVVFSLQDAPLTAQWLGLTIHDGVIAPSGRLCWHLTLFGCRYSQAVRRQMENSHVHPSTTNITLPSTWLSSPTTSEPTTTPYTTEPVGEPTTVIVTVTEVVRDYRMLIIVVPTAVCTVLLVLVIVTVGVLICLRGRNWRSAREFSKIPSTETLRVLDNTTLYGKTSNPTLPSTLNRVQVLPNTPRPARLQLGDALYENQLSPPPLTQEPHPYEAVTPTQCTAQRTNSMVDNPTYNVPFHPPPPPLSPPPPPPPDSPVKPPRIDVVNNECYSMSLSSESYANYDATEDLDYYSTGNIYETPQ